MTAALESEPDAVTVRAPAKINLHLGVGALRPDGFHPLDTIYQAISLYDDVTVMEAPQWSVSVAPVGGIDVSGVPLDDANIAVRAGRLLAQRHGLDLAAEIAIAKGIPVAGGMAGGSADAAAALVALDRLWDLRTSDEDLLEMAAELGSDVSFALLGGTARGTGRGELVSPVPDNGTWWWVVLPSSAGLSTPAVYRSYDEHAAREPEPREPGGPAAPDDLLVALVVGDAGSLGDALRNDLEPAARALRPELAATAEAMTAAGARRVLLSGSGPTLLGLADTKEDALLTREALLAQGREALVATGPVAGAHVVEYA